MERVEVAIPVPTSADVRSAYIATQKALRKAAREAGRTARRIDKGVDHALYKCKSETRNAGYAVVRPFYTTRTTAFGLETMNPFKLLGNWLRLKGVISEGYDHDRDSYVRRVNAGPFSVSYTVHQFHGGHWKVPSNPIKREPPRYKLTRPGMRAMYFGDLEDLHTRMRDLPKQPGFLVAPESPFILQDQTKKRYAFIHPGRIEVRQGLAKQVPFPG